MNLNGKSCAQVVNPYARDAGLAVTEIAEESAPFDLLKYERQSK